MAVRKTRRLYRSGHYYNGQGVSYAGSLLKSGYYILKVHKKNVSTHRAVAWFWPRDGRRPVMPWILDVDHVDKNYETIDYTQLRWVTKQMHNRKHATKKKNNANSRPIHGRIVGEDAWTVYPSLSEGVRQSKCQLSGVSLCANKKQRNTRASDGQVWEWEWCGIDAVDGEAWRTCILPDGTAVPHIKISNTGMLLKNDTLKTAGCIDGGYHKVRIGEYSYLVHRLVASTWHRLPHNGEVCDHMNRVTTDNRATNLRWTTSAENNANCDRPVTYVSHATPVQPFFDPECTHSVHDPFESMTEAAHHYGLKDSASIGNALAGRASSAGKLDGRVLYWKRVEEDYGPSAEIDDALANHLELWKGERLAARLRAEDARLTTPILEAPGEGQILYFEDLGDGKLRFYADDVLLGDACANPYRLTGRRGEDGVWRLYELV